MEDYIVRFYRRKEKNGGLFGVVEEVGMEGKKAFRSMEELVSLLKGDKPDDHREVERDRISIPATVDGTDSSGKPFTEKTVIEGLNPHGAWFRLNTRVVEGNELNLRIEPAWCVRKKNARVARVSEGPDPRIVEVVIR